MYPVTMALGAQEFWEKTRDIIIHSRNLEEEHTTHTGGGGVGAHSDGRAGAHNAICDLDMSLVHIFVFATSLKLYMSMIF